MSIPCYDQWKYAGGQTKDGTDEQMAPIVLFVKLRPLQPRSLAPLLCVALLVLRQGVDGQARAEVGAVDQPPVISDRTFLLQVRSY